MASHSQMKRIVLILFLVSLFVANCDNAAPESAQSQEVLAAVDPTDAPPEPTATPPPTDTPRPTDTPEPTATPVPTDTPVPTETPVPTATIQPTNTPGPTRTPGPPVAFAISPNLVGPDNCPLVSFDPELWSPMRAYFLPAGGTEERYHFSADEEDFGFTALLYTHGGAWNEQLGTFPISCTINAGNFCIFLRVGEVDTYLAAAGEIEIISLERIEDTISGPVEFTMTNLTMQPGLNSIGTEGCYHIDELTLKVEEP